MAGEGVSRVVLVGLRCSGKTTVGRLVARELGWDFADADEEVVLREGRSIREIFDSEGEGAFRAIERAVVADLCRRERVVIALGGGAVLDPENVRAMRQGALVAHLDAPPEVLWERMSRDPKTGAQRPGLTSLEGLEEMRLVAAKRKALYESARHMVVDAGGVSAEEAARLIAGALGQPRDRSTGGRALG
jgi:shikimate kinase